MKKSELDLAILIKSFENWADYREKRNLTFHEYCDKMTLPILDIIPEFIKETEFLINSLDGILTDD